MEVMRAIESADALCPNHYTIEEKLMWCDEVTAEIRRSVIKVYDMIQTEIDNHGELLLPDDFPFERIETVYVGNQRMDKQDFRSFINEAESGISYSQPKKIKIVYLKLPEKIRYSDIRGEFNTGGDTIEIELAPFREGDKIEIAALDDLKGEPDWDSAESAYVVEVQLDKIILDSDAAPPQTAAKLAIRRIIDDLTEIDEAPYDGMYIEYILAKMAMYQHDYVGYNAHMTQYNCLFENMRREYKTRSPLTTLACFRNFSIV